jgi:hypothetical protein
MICNRNAQEAESMKKSERPLLAACRLSTLDFECQLSGKQALYIPSAVTGNKKALPLSNFRESFQQRLIWTYFIFELTQLQDI